MGRPRGVHILLTTPRDAVAIDIDTTSKGVFNDMRNFRIGAFLVLTILVGIVGLVAYNLGVSAGTAEAAISAGASVIYTAPVISPFAFIIGGFMLLLFIGFLARAFMGPRRHMGPGAWGHYGHRGHRADFEDVPEPFRPMLQRWHDQAHAAPAADGPSVSPPASDEPPTGA